MVEKVLAELFNQSTKPAEGGKGLLLAQQSLLLILFNTYLNDLSTHIIII